MLHVNFFGWLFLKPHMEYSEGNIVGDKAKGRISTKQSTPNFPKNKHFLLRLYVRRYKKVFRGYRKTPVA